MRKVVNIAVFLAITLAAGMTVCAENEGEEYAAIPVKNMVTMVDLGARKCIPCKMMAPILKKLRREYKGRASIIFIDVWQDKSQAGRFSVSAIPTQIFFNKTGNEVYRHTGFMAEDAIVKQFEKMGIRRPTEKKR